MKRYFLIVPMLTLLLAAADPEEDAAKKDKDKLQGTWKLVAGEIFNSGSAFQAPQEEVVLEKVTVKGDDWTFRREKVPGSIGKEKEEQARCQLDLTKEPKTIDITWTDGENKGKTYPGVFTLEDDTLKICYAREGKERPTGFTAEATKVIKVHCILMVLKRDQP